MQEIWKDVVGYDGFYQVSNLGNVKSLRRKNVINIKLFDNGCGYNICGIYKNGKLKSEKVHRLVAMAFIPNPLNLPSVNHINAIRKDNRVENLEWCTQKQNAKHANNIGSFNNYDKICRDRFSKKVINIKTNEIKNSVAELSKESNYCYAHLLRMINGSAKNKTDYIYFNIENLTK